MWWLRKKNYLRILPKMLWWRSAWVFYKCYFVKKVEKKTETLEHFKTAIGSTVKSLSNSENVEISFGNQNTKIKKNTIRLPDIEKIDNKVNFKQIRALADSESLKIRFSNLKTYKLYEPKGNISKKLYKIAEKIRYEKLGSDKFIGVKNNIQQYYEERLNSLIRLHKELDI